VQRLDNDRLRDDHACGPVEKYSDAGVRVASKKSNGRDDTGPTIEQVPLGDLSPAEYNPRVISDSQLSALEASVLRFGMPDPIIANRRDDGRLVIVGGHQRARVAQKVGLASVPVVIVNLAEREEKALNLALNRIRGEFDPAALAPLLAEIQAGGVGDLLATGFSEQEAMAIARDLDRKTTPPDEFKNVGDGLDTDHACPRCGYAWSGPCQPT